jgi:SAM-dependent methyltransferase
MPEVRGAIWYEHWHRYAAAAPLAAGRRVLDAACGEGYGSYLLAAHAAQVTGVDIDASTIDHARARYARDNLAYEPASVTALPMADASLDLIVSFETIEHLSNQREMLAEFRRVLAPGGALVVSSPNRPVYNEAGGMPNHFHVKELDRAELKALLDAGFPQQAWHGQRVTAHSLLWSEMSSQGAIGYDVLAEDSVARHAAPADPMYFIVVCGAVDATLPVLPALSLFDDGALTLWRDCARTAARERQLTWDELDARKVAEDRLEELVTAVNALSSERQKTGALRARVEGLEQVKRAASSRASRPSMPRRARAWPIGRRRWAGHAGRSAPHAAG